MKLDIKRSMQIVGWSLAGLFALYMIAPICFVLLPWLSFRSYKTERQPEAAKLIAEFHHRFNAGDFDAICRDAYKCSDFPSLRQDWQSVLEETRNRGGAFKSIVQSDIQVYIEPPAVRATYVSSFEKTNCTEIFDFKDFDLKDGRVARGPLKIISYRVLIDGKQIPPPQGKGDDAGKLD